MSKPSERIGEDAATRAPEIIDAIQGRPAGEAAGRLAVNLAIAAKVDAVVVELDREATRRAAWEKRIDERLREMEQRSAPSIQGLSQGQYKVTAPEYTEEATD